MKIRLKFHKKKVIKACIALSIVPAVFFIATLSLPILSDSLGGLTAFSLAADYPVLERTVQYGATKNSVFYNAGAAVEQAQAEHSSTEDAASEEVSQPTESGEKPAAAGVITRKTYKEANTSAYLSLGKGYIKNCTSLSSAQILDTVSKKPDIKIAADGSPEVLIMHTHTTECYQEKLNSWYDLTAATRTRDESKNMVRIGEEIAKQLKAAGIGVLHDTTQHDYPSYTGAYERSAVTVKKYLEKYPTIKIVLDVHRDAIQPTETEMVAPVTKINGKDCAQIMIISGADNGKLNMPKYMENLKFSAALQRQMEGDYKTLTRPILFDYRKYNQDLTTGSILLEVGGHGNTLEEAIYCGELVGKSMAKTLIALK